MVRVKMFDEDTAYSLSRKVESFVNGIGAEKLVDIGYTVYNVGYIHHHIAYITYTFGG